MWTDTPAVEVRGLVKRFGDVCALDGVDLRVDVGELRGVLGPNGAGKTTLLRTLFGLVPPDAGTVRLLGRASPTGGGLDGVAGFVEEPRFYPYLSARENLELLARLDGGAAHGRVDEALGLVGLTAHARRRAGTLSSGMRQRLGLAAALLGEPQLLVLDEPTVGLDPAEGRRVRELMRELSRRGVALVLSSHDMAEVDGLCDSVTVLRSGRVVWDGTVGRLRSEAPSPSHRLATSDDRAALAFAPEGVTVAAAEDGRLTASGGQRALDAYVLSLARAGIAVRRLELPVSPVEAMFLRLTADDEDGRHAEPAGTAGGIR